MQTLSGVLAEMERIYNEGGPEAMEAFGSEASDSEPTWADELAHFANILTGEYDDAPIPAEVATSVARSTRALLARLHAAEADRDGLVSVAESNREAYEAALDGAAHLTLSDDNPTRSQCEAAIRRLYPEAAHTLEWTEHPNDWENDCFCAECWDA